MPRLTIISFASACVLAASPVLAQSAATAAVMALEDNLAVQDLPYAKLRARLLQDGQVLESPAGR